MKTFKQYLNESVKEVDSVTSIIHMIKATSPGNLASIMSAPDFLFRGSNSSRVSEVAITQTNKYIVRLFEVGIRQDRRPLTVNRHLSAKYDEWFENKGWGTPRSSGLFAASGPEAFDTASTYGKTYAVFPYTDSAKFVWSEEVSDLFFTAQGQVAGGSSQDEVNEFMDSLNWKQSTNPSDAINDAESSEIGIEVMITNQEKCWMVHITDLDGDTDRIDDSTYRRVLKEAYQLIPKE